MISVCLFTVDRGRQGRGAERAQRRCLACLFPLLSFAALGCALKPSCHLLPSPRCSPPSKRGWGHPPRSSAGLPLYAIYKHTSIDPPTPTPCSVSTSRSSELKSRQPHEPTTVSDAGLSVSSASARAREREQSSWEGRRVVQMFSSRGGREVQADVPKQRGAGTASTGDACMAVSARRRVQDTLQAWSRYAVPPRLEQRGLYLYLSPFSSRGGDGRAVLGTVAQTFHVRATARLARLAGALSPPLLPAIFSELCRRCTRHLLTSMLCPCPRAFNFSSFFFSSSHTTRPSPRDVVRWPFLHRSTYCHAIHVKMPTATAPA